MSPSVEDLDTPVLLWDLDILQRNISEMATLARNAGIRLRPHTKTHKSPEVARLQVEAGASGITVAKLGEAEVMADAGFNDLLIAYPILGPAKLARLRELMERAEVRISLDSVQVAEGLAALGRDRRQPVEILIEVDTGLHRMGRPPGEPTARLVGEIAAIKGVEVIGLLTHAGHAHAATTPQQLRDIAASEVEDLVQTAELCALAGVAIREISVGSTPTARAVAGLAGVTEIRPGTYVFNDVDQMRLGVAEEDTCAARVLSTVVSQPWGTRFLIDAGSKSLTSDGGDGPPFPGRGMIAGRPQLRLDFLNEEHGVGHAEQGPPPAIGERLQVIPLHICPCVNLFDVAYGVRGGRVETELAISGRGKVR